jgi:hypothetical protein
VGACALVSVATVEREEAMGFVLPRLIRVTALTGIGLGLVAVGLGRSGGAAMPGRSPAPIRHAIFVSTPSSVDGPGASLMDRETGRVAPLARVPGERLDLVSFSPWRDEDGRVQLVGRLQRWTKDKNAIDLCLVRLASLGGRVLDRVPMDSVPDSAPCWEPGPAPHILFTTLDGRLRHLAFDDVVAPPPTPRPVLWRELPEGATGVEMTGPVWPTGSATAGRLLISLRLRDGRDYARERLDPMKIWWLELDRASLEVTAAGPLSIDRPGPASDPDREEEELLPAVGRSPSGGSRVAFLARRPGERLWRLRVGPLAAGPSGEPMLRRADVRTVAEGCALAAPSFALDGRWVAYLPATPAGGGGALAPGIVWLDGAGPGR